MLIFDDTNSLRQCPGQLNANAVAGSGRADKDLQLDTLAKEHSMSSDT